MTWFPAHSGIQQVASRCLKAIEVDPSNTAKVSKIMKNRMDMIENQLNDNDSSNQKSSK